MSAVFNATIGSSAAGGADIGDNIPYSVMLDRGSLQYLSRTVTTSATATYAMAFKRGILGAICPLIDTNIKFNANDTLTAFGLTTTAVFRDPTAWLFIHVSNGGLYVNGVSYGAVTTSALTNPRIGFDGTNYADGYMAMCYIVDGTSDAYTNYGRISADSGQWANKNASPTYGAKGSLLTFTNSGALGTDSSGNGNNWTLNSITSANQYTDTPTNNHSVFNKLSTVTTSVLSVGNTKMTASTIAIGSLGMTGTMKSYWEVSSTTAATLIGMYGTAATTTISVAAAKTYGMRFDAGAGTLDYINITDAGSWTSLATSLTTTPYFQYASTAASAIATINSGSKSFVGTVPSGYLALNTANLPTPAIIKPSLHFQTLLDTGANIKANTAALFTYYWNWIKDRANVNNHQLIDTVRGSTAVLQSNTTAAETTYSAPAGSSVGWAWNMDSTAVSNTNGSITSSVSANTLAGQSVVAYTGTGANATVGHGLLAAPELVVCKKRSSTGHWVAWHSKLLGTEYLILNTTNAKSAAATVWNSTAPSGTVFSLGSDTDVNANTLTNVALCFHSVEGYSKVFSYTGNANADGAFVYLGFKARFILLKCSSTTGTWYILDTVRKTINPLGAQLYPNTTAAESTITTFDVTATGIKLRLAGDPNLAQTYIGYAVAEAPTKYATGR